MIQVFFHGTRGSFSTSASTHAKYGGHTSCVSILFEGQWFIFDAGSGLINAADVIQDKNIKSCHLFLSHLHLDHISGLPAFPLSWDPSFEIKFYCGISQNYNGLESVFRDVFKPPYFPVIWDDFKAHRTYQDFSAGESFHLNDDARIETILLDHPGGACGYKLYLNNRTIVYLTDTTHDDTTLNRYAKFAKGCDLLIYDSTYCESEFAPVAHFGHSTWQKACDLAVEADVKQLALFHHDPGHSDGFIDGMEIQARLKFPHTFAAACGMVVEI